MTDKKNRDLAISATSKIHANILRALKEKDSHRRWFWELLQNAKDTVVFKKGITTDLNQPGRKVSVKIYTGNDAVRGPFARYEHNGNPFRQSNHPYKFDDPKCLLLADSGKIEEDESLREDITGQFGTGFLSTHILSLNILVEGIFLDNQQNSFSFSFELDRKYNNKLELPQKVERSLDQYDSDFKPGELNLGSFSTKFTYFLSDNKDSLEKGEEVLNNGLTDIGVYIPYVLSFCNEIDTAKVLNEREDIAIFYCRSDEIDRQDKQIQIVPVLKQITDLKGEKTIEEVTTFIARCSSLNDHLDIAIELTKTNTGNYSINPINPDKVALFCQFPLVGSENFRFPVVINSSRFVPNVERDGISLQSESDKGNWDKIHGAIELYKILLNYAIDAKWSGVYQLAKTFFEYCPKWVMETSYRDTLNIVREYLLIKPIVQNNRNQAILLKEARFPSSVNQSSFWDICYDFIGDFIPAKDDLDVWHKIIAVDFDPFNQLELTIENLLKLVEGYGKLDKLAKDKFNYSKKNAIDWLNRLYDFILSNYAGKAHFETNAVIPNQLGDLQKLGPLRYDVKIPDDFKNILSLMNMEKRDVLIDAHIIKFVDQMPLNLQDVSEMVNRHISDQKRKDDEHFVHAMFSLASYFTSDLSEKRNTIYEFAKTIFPDNIVGRKIIPGTSDFEFDRVNLWIVKRIVAVVSAQETLNNLSAKIHNGDMPTTVRWINDLLNFVNSTQEYRTLLDDKKIVPNQYNEFCILKGLNDDTDKIPDEFKDIIYSLTNKKDDLRAILKHKDIQISLNKPYTLRQACNKLDDLVKENKDNLDNIKIRDSILRLVKWTSEHKDDFQLEDSFNYFSKNKANLFLSTFDNPRDRDNVFDILQSGKSKELATLAKTNLSAETINLIADLNKTLNLESKLLMLKELPELTLETLQKYKMLDDLSMGWDAKYENNADAQKTWDNLQIGWKGEAFVYKEMKKRGYLVEWPNLSEILNANVIVDHEGESHSISDKYQQYDLKATNIDGHALFIQVKTTVTDLAKADHINLPISTNEWNFVHETDGGSAYYLARVFSIHEKPEVYFLKLTKPDSLA